MRHYQLKLIAMIGACCGAFAAHAQMPMPAAKPVDGAALFKQQCAVCHTLSRSEPTSQGPPLDNVVGRKAGSVEGFKYSAGFAKTDLVWDEAKLNAYLENPQAVVAGSVMAYRQAKPETRVAIINFLKDQK